MKILTLFGLLALIAVPLAAQAGSSSLSKLSSLRSPGEWEFIVTRRVEVPGTSMSVPPKTITKKMCLSKQVIDQPLSEKLKGLGSFAHKEGEICESVKGNLTGNTLTFVMNCSGKRGTVHVFGKRVYDSKATSHSHVQLTTKTDGMPMEIKLDTHAKRIGECKAQITGK